MAKKLHEEDLILNIKVGADPARKELLDLASQIKDDNAELKKMQDTLKTTGQLMGKGSSEYKKQAAAIDAHKKKIEENREKLRGMMSQMKATSLTTKELRQRIKDLSAQMSNIVPGTKEWKDLNRRLQEAKTRLKDLETQTSSTGRTLYKLFENLPSIAVINQAVGRLTARTEKYRQAWMNYDEALTDARKTTKLTRDEIEAVAAELKKIDTRTPTTELLGLVQVAGKLGVSGQENLLGFARAADKINVALSAELGGDAEAAITAIGKMVDIFGLIDQYGYEDSMLKIGSALKELGMASTASEGFIVEFTRRLAGIAPNADISIDKVLGLAATLDKYGQAAETSATSIGQVIMAMFKRTETFAKIAKMPLEDFKNLLQTDVNEALLRVLEGMKGSEGTLADITAAMGEMHLNGQRAATVLGALSNNVGELRHQQELSKNAFDDGSAIINEFNLKNETAQAEVEKLNNRITGLRAELGQKLQPAYVATLSATNSLLSMVIQLIDWFGKYRVEIISLTVAIAAIVAQEKLQAYWTGMVTAAKKLAAMWSKTNRLALLKETATMAAQIGTEKAATAGTAALAAAKALLTGNVKALTLATKSLWAAMKANPLGIVLAAVGALTAAYSTLRRRTKETSESEAERNRQAKEWEGTLAKGLAEIDVEKQKLKELRDAALGAASGSNERKLAIDRINEAYKEYLPSLLSEKSSNDEIASSLDTVNRKMEESMRLRLRASSMEAIEQDFLTGVENTYQKSLGRRSSLGSIYGAMQVDADAMQQEWAKPIIMEVVSGIMSYRRGGGSRANDYNAVLKPLVEKYKKEFLDADKAIRAIYMTIDAADPQNLANEILTRQKNLDTLIPLSTSASVSGNTAGADYNNGSDDAKGKWSLAKDEAFLKEKSALQKKYLSGEIATEGLYNEQLLALEIEYLQRRLDSQKETGKVREALEVQLGEKQLKQRQDFNNKIELLSKEDEQLEKKKQELSERSIARMKEDYELEKLATANLYDARLALVEKGSDAEKKLQKDKAKALLKIDREYLTELKILLEEIIETGMLGGVELPEEQLAQYKKRLQEIVRDLLKNGSDEKGLDSSSSSSSMAGKGSLFGVDQAQWEQLFKNLEQGKIGTEAWTSAINAMQGIAGEAFDFVSKSISLTSAKEKKALSEYEKSNEKKKNALKDRYDAGLMTEQQYNAEVAALESAMEARREEMERKQAQRAKTAAIIESIINTALAVSKAFAQWGWPAGLVAGDIIGALGAAQTAIIASQPAGYEQGGMIEAQRAQDGKIFQARYAPDQRGYINRPTVITGEAGQEYVLPAEAVNNPSIRPYINTIESARKAGRLRSLNLAAVYPAGTFSGRVAGGSIDAPPGDGQGGMVTVDPTLIAEFTASVKRFSAMLEKPIEATVNYLGPRGIKKAIEKDATYQRRGSLG